MKRADVVVVGGGVVGAAIAYFLARERVSVAVLEREDFAAQASGAAAGMLAPAIEAEREGPLLALGLRSLELFPPLVEELREGSGVDPHFVRSGVLRVATSDEEAASLRRKAGSLGGCELEWVDEAAVRAREPHLAREVRGALWSSRGGHVRSALLTRAFALAAEGLGTRLERGVPVVGLRRQGNRVTGVRTPAGDWSAAWVVVATGSWAGEAATWLGLEQTLPVTPVRGQLLALDVPSPLLHAIVWGADAYLVPRDDGTVLVGATEERVGFDARVTVEGLRSLLAAAPRLVPALSRAGFHGAWAGLRPDTPDHRPALGPLPGLDGLLLATGHYRNGVLLAPVTGRLMADLILGKGLAPDARAFLPERLLAG